MTVGAYALNDFNNIPTFTMLHNLLNLAEILTENPGGGKLKLGFGGLESMLIRAELKSK